MPQSFRDEDAVLLRFGGGRNSRASEDQVHPLECHAGQNFLLDPGNAEFKPREGFELVGTVPNAQSVDGLVTLRRTDGAVSMLVQGGTVVYEWDGSSFTSVGSVASGAKLRGRKEAFYALDDKVLIADIALQDDVHSWDGTTFQQETFLQEDGSTAFGPFRAKYILVDNERALYANIFKNSANFPHLLVGSERGDFLIVSNATRPSSGANAEDAWFLPMPQLKPINGMAKGFGVIGISAEDGDFEKLTGTSAQDFELVKLHEDSGALGDEAVVSIVNDIVYGSSGRIESLQATDKFGDVERDDLSFKIQPDVKTFDDWTLVYNQRLKRLYCFPAGESEVHVAFVDFIGSELSPWSKYVTIHSFGFQPTVVMNARDPADDLEYVFMGDGAGNLWRMEGSGSADGGSADIRAARTSQLQSAKLDASTFNAHGWLQFRKNQVNTADLKFLFSGEHVYDKTVTVNMPAAVIDTVYGGGDVYYGGDFYYGISQLNRLVRSTFGLAHFANQWQVEVAVEGQNDFRITEIGIRYDEAS